MKNAIHLFTVAAVIILVFAFMAGIYPHHDYVFSTFLVAWALATAWVGGVVATRFR